MLTCAALILNHNGQHLLPPLYASLLRQRALTSIVLIDNASTDDSVELSRSISDRIEIDKNSENLDFGTAYNRAIAKRSEDVILILNNDTVVHNDAVYRALLLLEQNPEIATVSFEGLFPETPGGYPQAAAPLTRFGKELAPARHSVSAETPAVIMPCFMWGLNNIICGGIVIRKC